MEFKGTKGIWDYTKCQISNAINITSDGGLTSIGNIYTITFCGEYFNEETEANALLISKAPEMLEMLKKCCYEFENYRKAFGQGSNLESDIEQLIKEATELNK